jgi:pre-mRNA-splicing factor CWC22
MAKDNPRNTRFCINFFTSIGLGGLTDDLRDHLKSAPKMIMAQEREDLESSSTSSSSSSSSESDSSSGTVVSVHYCVSILTSLATVLVLPY